MFGWWSYWHYQKQHYGVYCFVKSYYDLRSSPIERFVILTATLPAMIAIVPVVIDSNGTDLERRIIAHYGWALHSVGILFLLGVGVLGVSLAIGALRAADGSARRQLVPAALLTFLAANYWPFFFFKDVSLAAAMATGGHGLQYVVFMIVYAYNGSPPSGGPPRKRAFRGAASLVVMFALAAGLWKITEVLPAQTILGLDNAALGGALATLGVSMTGAHYLLDAVLWRLSDRNSRELVVGKYGFLFANRV
jgi:hypothetical protein